MTEWLKANPAKAKKSRWRAFVTAWLTRSQNRGGGKASTRPGDAAPAKAWGDRATWRDDACQNMTETKYREWRAAQRPSGIARTLSNAISLREGNSAAQTTNGRPGANAEVLESTAEAEEHDHFDPVRDGWIGSDGRP
jgi:hypothetical protein